MVNRHVPHHHLAKLPSFLLSPRRSSVPKKKVILDTDAGVDDAVAIIVALHLAQKHGHEIVAISTVSGNVGVDKVVKNVAQILNVCQRTDIPIVRGCSKPLVGPTNDASHYHGSDGLGNANLPDPMNQIHILEGPAAMHLTRLAKEHVGELTLIALGPLTNVAVAIALDEDFCSNLKELFWMGGCLAGPGNITATAEFNAYADPEALQVCLRQHCQMTWASWELCLQNVISWEEWDTITASSCDAPVAQFIHHVTNIFRERRQVQLETGWNSGEIICDPIAIVTALGEVEYSTIHQNVSVVTNSGVMRGTTIGDMRINELLNSRPPGAEESVVKYILPERYDNYTEILKEAITRFGLNTTEVLMSS